MFQYLLEFIHNRAPHMRRVKPPLLYFRYELWVGNLEFIETEGPSVVGSFQFHEEENILVFGPRRMENDCQFIDLIMEKWVGDEKFV